MEVMYLEEIEPSIDIREDQYKQQQYTKYLIALLKYVFLDIVAAGMLFYFVYMRYCTVNEFILLFLIFFGGITIYATRKG